MNIEYGVLARYYDTETNFLINIIGNRKTILDAGCGTGTHMANLDNHNFIVDGFDFSNEMLNIAKKKVRG